MTTPRIEPAIVPSMAPLTGPPRSNPGAPLPPSDWHAYLSRHGKSFWLASRLMPQPQRDQLVAVYAYCRYTDDLVDAGSGGPSELLDRLDWWEDASREAYRGRCTGIALLDTVMTDMAGAKVPFAYAAALLCGMRQDVLRARFVTLGQLHEYCYNVASVVGRWLTELFGTHDAWTLARAGDLGAAMQLTNIARDVGEDWSRGRLYLPRELLDAHGIDASVIARLYTTPAPVPSSYAEAIEQVLETAEALYAGADAAIANLPSFFQPAVAVASRVYRGIHDAIRANGYDNIRKRAVLSDSEKLRMAGEAHLRVRRHSALVAGESAQ